MLRNNRSEALRLKTIDFYTESCSKYGVDTDAGVLVALRFGRSKLRTSESFTDKGVLPLVEVLLHFPELKNQFRVLDFSHGAISSHGAVALGEMMKAVDHSVEELNLKNNKLGSHGARAIVNALIDNSITKVVNLRGCWIGERGGVYLSRKLLTNKSTALTTLDLSLNAMGYRGMKAVDGALARRTAHGLDVMEVDLHGNNLNAEIGNAVTHGIGFIFCILGSIFMGMHTAARGLQEPNGLTPIRHTLCISVYCVSLCVLYISSTLYHSFFALEDLRAIFSVFDQSAIYILIAGSYTPFLGMTFPDKPQWSVYLLGFMWMCCFCGVFIEATMGDGKGCGCGCDHNSDHGHGHRDDCHEKKLCESDFEVIAKVTKKDHQDKTHTHTHIHTNVHANTDSDTDTEEESKTEPYTDVLQQLTETPKGWNINKSQLSLCMYLGMGWAAVFALPDLLVALNPNALMLLLAGGLCYTGGVPFFVRNKGMDHALWHVFVLAGSICHFAAIYFYVVPL